jgi:hypothetical protein
MVGRKRDWINGGSCSHRPLLLLTFEVKAVLPEAGSDECLPLCGPALGGLPALSPSSNLTVVSGVKSSCNVDQQSAFYLTVHCEFFLLYLHSSHH